MVGKVTPDTMLSASRLPAVMGYSKYRSPNDELLASIDALGNKETPFVTNEAMEWGNRTEAMILEEAAVRLGVSNLITQHPEPYFHPLLKLACSLDATADGSGITIANDPDKGIMVMDGDVITLEGTGVLEAKLTSVAPEHSPALYRGVIQLQAQMDITGAKWGALAVLYRGTELRIFLFKPHEATLRAIADATLDFQRRLGILNTIHLSILPMLIEHGVRQMSRQSVLAASLRSGHGIFSKRKQISNSPKPSLMTARSRSKQP